MTELIARKILRDDGAESNIAFTDEELVLSQQQQR